MYDICIYIHKSFSWLYDIIIIIIIIIIYIYIYVNMLLYNSVRVPDILNRA